MRSVYSVESLLLRTVKNKNAIGIALFGESPDTGGKTLPSRMGEGLALDGAQLVQWDGFN